MNIKHLLVAVALCGATVGCTDEEVGKESPLQGQPGEIQLVFTGSGESVEYPTKAIASEKENNIDELDIYVFAAATMTTDPDDWHYLETWSTRAGAANSFTLQNSGSSWKASIKPGELKGLPYLKLYCVANLPNGNRYKLDGSDADALTAVTTDDKGIITVPGTLESAFIPTYTAKLLKAGEGGATWLKTPLIMQGSSATKISGSASVVNIELKRLVARFDIDNIALKSRLTINSITVANARSNAPLFGEALKEIDKADRATTLITYAADDFTKLSGANMGMTESALYIYPNMPSDSSYLIVRGKFRSTVGGGESPVTYPVKITRTDNTDPNNPITEYVQILSNNRYKLHITDVINSSIQATLEVEDWTSGGGVDNKPDNAAPEFLGDASLSIVNKDDDVVQVPVVINENPYVLRVNEESGRFKMMVLASSKVEAEMSVMTKTYGGWLGEPTYAYDTDTVPGKTATFLTFTYADAVRKAPCQITLRNTAANYDPALWTTLTVYGPVVAPVLSNAGKHSEGNSLDLTKTPAEANLFNVKGSQALVDIMCIEGVTYNEPEGIKISPVATDGFTTTYAIQIADTTKARASVTTDPNITFTNQANTIQNADTILKVNLLDPAITFDISSDDKTATTITADTIEVDTDQLSDGTFTIKVSSSLDPVLPQNTDCTWLTISKVAANWETGTHEYVEYTVSNQTDVTEFTECNLTFTNRLMNGPNLTVTLKKKEATATP